MNALTISDIFSNLEYYKEQYLAILAHPEQYFTPVAHAYVQVWPLAKEQLYLGDLLQLWLGGEMAGKFRTAAVNQYGFKGKSQACARV